MRHFVFVLGLIAFLAPAPTFAGGGCDLSEISVQIRAVRAEGRVDAAVAAHPESDMVEVDSRIGDLAPKLQKLRFQNFRLVSSQREVVPLGRRQTVALIDGNQLTLRPLTLENNRVGMWIKWQDGSGMQVLDTRMHFDVGETMVTGVDGKSDSGLILAIDVTPVTRHVPEVKPVAGER